MGEKSRTIGFLGENIITNIFKMFGWRGTDGIEIKCNKRRKHNKRTHDIDFFSSYACPLENNTQENLYVSVKYEKCEPNPEKKFIKYAETIIQSSECFVNAPLYSQVSSSNYPKRNKSIILCWLFHNIPTDYDLIKKLVNVKTKIEGDFENVYILDNKRITFLFNAINFAQNLYPNYPIEFEYIKTGINEKNDGGRKLSGNILPVQYINSSILPIRINQEKQKILILFLNEKFEENSLKRLIGFAQNLTAGWCNKIILCFPDYQEKEHKYIRQSTLMKFSESNFDEMIEVKSFYTTFKSFENTDYIGFSKPNEIAPEFNIETMLPFGDQMRQLINQSYIYKHDLQVFLKKRGIHIARNLGKDMLAPFFAKTIISPNEFEFLKRKQLSKENADRIFRQTLKLKQENTELDEVVEAVQNKVNFREVFQQNDPTAEIIEETGFVEDKNGAYRKTIKTKSSKLTKDWAQPKAYTKHEIVIKPNQKKSEVFIDYVADSSEGNTLNKKISPKINKELIKKQYVVNKNIQEDKMLANDLTNEKRTEFLFNLAFLENIENNLSFFSITNVQIRPNNEKALPDDIKSLKDRVEQQTFTGKDLQEIAYIKDKKYRDFFIFESINLEYNFTFEELKGRIRIEFGYPKLTDLPDDKSEFEYKIIEIIPFTEANLSKKEYHELDVNIKDIFSDIVSELYAKIEKKYGKQMNIGL